MTTAPDPTPTPDVAHRVELTFELAGTPEQVWDAIATAHGISTWMAVTEMEEREGGSIRFHLPGDFTSSGTVRTYDPPRRIVYEEPDWAELAGQDPATTTPMATEFVIEATSGGSCVLRVVTSAFGVGAAWEDEFFTDMVKHWTPQFETLKLHVANFAGQRSTPFEAMRNVAADPAHAAAAVRDALGIERVGQRVELLEMVGTLSSVDASPAPDAVWVLMSSPVPGIVRVASSDSSPMGIEGATIWVAGLFYGDDAEAFVDEIRSPWTAWLDDLVDDLAS